MKKFFLTPTLFFLFTVCIEGYSQFKINNYNLVQLSSQTQDWHSAFRTYVPTIQSCSYNLWSTIQNKDVFFVCAEGWLWALQGGYFGSDISFKEDLSTIDKALDKVLRLNGVKYRFKTDEPKEENFRFGFIAQEVFDICPEVVKFMPDSTLAIAYTDLIAVLVEAIKEQQSIIEQIHQEQLYLSKENERYKLFFKQIETDASEVKYSNQSFNNDTIITNHIFPLHSLRVYQNHPNPFLQTTIIDCIIPNRYKNTYLCIFDRSGILQEQIQIAERGSVSIELQTNKLQPGIYLYLLYADGECSNTEKMIITKD